MAAKFITEHLDAHELLPAQVSRYWLHQANQKLNELVAQYVLGRDATRTEAPIILDEYGNTASAGSLIAFSLHNGGSGRPAATASCRRSARATRSRACCCSGCELTGGPGDLGPLRHGGSAVRWSRAHGALRERRAAEVRACRVYG